MIFVNGCLLAREDFLLTPDSLALNTDVARGFALGAVEVAFGLPGRRFAGALSTVVILQCAMDRMSVGGVLERDAAMLLSMLSRKEVALAKSKQTPQSHDSQKCTKFRRSIIMAAELRRQGLRRDCEMTGSELEEDVIVIYQYIHKSCSH